MRSDPASAARSQLGTNAAQIASRPEPVAMPDRPKARQRTSVNPITRAVDGAVSGVAARMLVTTATTTYPR